MSSGKGSNRELALVKGLAECKYPNMQQLPHDQETRACFVAEKGNLFCSCDYAGMEARLGAMIYNEKKFIEEFLHGSGDMHSVFAKEAFPDDLKGIEVKDVKKLRPDLRTLAKSFGFSITFGSDGTATAKQLGLDVDKTRKQVANILKGLNGLREFKKINGEFVKTNGYILIHKDTGHRIHWEDWKKWVEEKKYFTPAFWNDYRLNHKNNPKSKVSAFVREHFKRGSYAERLSLNSPTQGAGAMILKDFCIAWFNWVVDNGYFGKILLVNLTHDEHNSEFPEELKDTYPKMVEKMMQEAGDKYFGLVPLYAEASVGYYWIH